jgi:hypothetical protein
VNTGPLRNGKLYTTWVFERIGSVAIVDGTDRSRKIGLGPQDWAYDPATTELSVLREMPFEDCVARIEGSPALPHAFVLNGIMDETDLLVTIGGRLAVEGVDYAFDKNGSRLTFRDDVDLKESDWSIRYPTPLGGAMIGEWKPENADRMSYIEAEHRRRWLDSWYDRQSAFWFLDDSRMDEWKEDPHWPPTLIRRPATPEELADMKSAPVNVIKFRTQTKDRDLSREIGFDARVPGSLIAESPRREYPLAWKTIEESSQDGILVSKLSIMYEDDPEEQSGQYVLDITMEKIAEKAAGPTEAEWLINEETVDLGLPVRVVRQWGTSVSDLDSEPTVVSLTTWTWTEGSILCQANSDSANDTRTAALLRRFIAARMKSE